MGNKQVKKDELNFAFEKKIGINECLLNDNSYLLNLIEKLIYCIKEINKIDGTTSEFFRLDFRPQNLHEQLNGEFPLNSLVLDLKFGYEKELENLGKE